MQRDPTGFSFLLSILMVFVVMYFLILRPQSKRQKERDKMLKQVKKGDRIVTSGGLYATVLAVKSDDVLVVRLGDNVRVDMSRSAVSAVVGPGSAPTVRIPATPRVRPAAASLSCARRELRLPGALPDPPTADTDDSVSARSRPHVRSC